MTYNLQAGPSVSRWTRLVRWLTALDEALDADDIGILAARIDRIEQAPKIGQSDAPPFEVKANPTAHVSR